MPYADPEKKRANDRDYYRRNRERRMAYITSWQDANPERVKQYKRNWNAANQEYRHEWYLANREKVIESAKENYRRRSEEQPDLVRALGRDRAARRRARERKAFVEYVDPNLVWQRDSGVCQICGHAADQDDWHLDHIIPISRGGDHSYSNTQVTHPFCNRSKAAS